VAIHSSSVNGHKEIIPRWRDFQAIDVAVFASHDRVEIIGRDYLA
jgi:hypothetical protein